MAVQGIVVILPQTLLGFLAGERFRFVVLPPSTPSPFADGDPALERVIACVDVAR